MAGLVASESAQLEAALAIPDPTVGRVLDTDYRGLWRPAPNAHASEPIDIDGDDGLMAPVEPEDMLDLADEVAVKQPLLGPQVVDFEEVVAMRREAGVGRAQSRRGRARAIMERAAVVAACVMAVLLIMALLVAIFE